MMKQISILLALSLFQISTQASRAIPHAADGVLDLRKSEGAIPVLPLSGEWAFYWEEFPEPGEVADESVPDIYAEVPNYWTSYKDEIPGITGAGYATYRLTILLPPGYRDSLALRIPIFDTSSEIYLNGTFIWGSGKVGKDAETSAPQYFPETYDFINSSDTLTILVRVANFSHRRGGFWLPMLFGNAHDILIRNERGEVISSALIGVLFLAFAFFLVLYLFDKKSLSFLFFSLTTLGILFRLLNTGYYPGNYLVNQQWVWTVRLEYLGTYTAFIFGLFYLDYFFPSGIMKKFIRLITSVFVIIAIVVLTTGPNIFGYTVFALYFFGAVCLSYYLIRAFMGILKHKRTDTLFFFSVLIFLLAAINDSLVSLSSSPLRMEYLLPFTFLLFILVQLVLLIEEWTRNYRDRISMQEELIHVNRNLESIIEKRTADLHRTNEELKQNLALRNRMFSIIAHDLKSPVANLAQYADLLMEKHTTGKDAKMIGELQRLAYSSAELIDNMLHWGMQQGRKIEYHPGQVQIKPLTDALVDLAKYSANNKQLNIKVQVPDDLFAWCDADLLKITLRNLITNAIKFTPEKGRIVITAKASGDLVAFSVTDNGIGIRKEKMERILEEETESTRGTDGERGTGLGLVVVRELVQINKGRLHLESKPDRGTTVTFTLPGKP